MIRTILTAASAAAALSLASLPALAQSTGLEGLHDKRREGGRVCFSDHFHDGSGSGANKKLAEVAAIKNWTEFTSWEYGAGWGSFRNAASKSLNCSGPKGAVSCSVSARPCRAGH